MHSLGDNHDVLEEEQQDHLRRLIARIDVDAFADRVLASYWDTLPGEPQEARRHAHMWVRWNLDLVVRWLTERRPPTDAELDVLRTRAYRQAQAGVPADRVPGNFRRAARFAWNAALELAEPDERAALLEAADLVFEFVDRVSRIYAEAHGQAGLSAPVAVEERLARGLLGRLVEDQPPTAEDVDFAARAGWRLDGTFHPFVVACPGAAGTEHLALAERLRARGVLAASEGRWVLALSRTPMADLALELSARATTAEGDLTAREQLGTVLDELRMLVDVAQSHGRAGPADPAHHLPELLLRSAPRMAARIRHQVYGPLRRHPHLAHTLDAYIAHDFNQQRAAAELPVHRNTFRERLSRISELTGLDLERAEDRGTAWLAHLYAPAPGAPSLPGFDPADGSKYSRSPR